MFVSGFTFVRNAIKFDYPVVEAILSVLPLCDEFVVAVGNSEDATRELIESIDSPKIRIIDTIWDDSLREGGKVLADETNKAFRELNPDADWCFYIQGDEVMHEKYLETVKQAMIQHKDDPKADGLLFHYKHFYGSYDYVGESPRWYRHEVRVVRRNPEIYSFGDAQGFRKGDKKLLSVKKVNAFIYHYGWVKPPHAMQLKQETFHKLWHDDQWMEKNVAKAEEFDYSNISLLGQFTETHPGVMLQRIKRVNWKFDFDVSIKRYTLKERFKLFFEKHTGWRPGEYKDFRII